MSTNPPPPPLPAPPGTPRGMPNALFHKAAESGGTSTPQPTGMEQPAHMKAKAMGKMHAHAGRRRKS